MSRITAEQSGAFIDQFTLPPTRSGPLDGLRFAVKDLIDVAGRPTGCGNPDWLATHPPPPVSAVCVDQLLAAGATCVGKTVCDELAFSLIGENHFYGTPLNPAAPDRVPGGSSSGSASAVACGLVDFALGTDTGGSIRIPASNCGIWGLRPTHGAVSVAGVMPFAPSFDTVGILARSADVLQRSMGVLLGCDVPPADEPTAVHLVPEAFALAEADVRAALAAPIEALRRRWGDRLRETSLGALCRDPAAANLDHWLKTFRLARGVEVESCLGAWLDAAHPRLGPATAATFALVRQLDRAQAADAVRRREQLARALAAALGPRDLVCIPSAPAVAPLQGTVDHDRHGDYYTRTVSLTALSGTARLPQLSLPLATTAAAPIGLSLLAAPGQDAWLMSLATTLPRSA